MRMEPGFELNVKKIFENYQRIIFWQAISFGLNKKAVGISLYDVVFELIEY